MAAHDVVKILFIVISLCAPLLVSSSRPLASSVYDVRDYGAIGDGNSDDTKVCFCSLYKSCFVSQKFWKYIYVIL